MIDFPKKKTFSDLFGKSWAKLLFETRSSRKLTNFEISQAFFQKKINSPEKFQFLNFVRSVKQKNNLKGNLEKIGVVCCLPTLKKSSLFGKKTISSPKKPKVERFPKSQTQTPFETHFKRDKACIWALKKSRFFIRKNKHLALQKVLNFERFENFESYKLFDTLSRKNNPRIGALQKVAVCYQKNPVFLP